MEKTMIVTTPTLSSRAALMLSKDPSPALDIVNARLMKIAPKTFPASSTAALWATAVWGTKPAADLNTRLNLPPLWDSNAVRTVSFPETAVETARYGAN